MVRNLDHRVEALEARVEGLLKAEYIPLNENLRIRAEQAKQFAHFQKRVAELSDRVYDLGVEHEKLKKNFEGISNQVSALRLGHNNLARSFERHKRDGHHPPVDVHSRVAVLMNELSERDQQMVYEYASALHTFAEGGQD